MAIDFIFIIDIAINCRTAYETPEGELEMSGLRMARRYAASWFLIDLTSSIPIDLILLIHSPEGENSEFKLTRLVKGMLTIPYPPHPPSSTSPPFSPPPRWIPLGG